VKGVRVEYDRVFLGYGDSVMKGIFSVGLASETVMSTVEEKV